MKNFRRYNFDERRSGAFTFRIGQLFIKWKRSTDTKISPESITVRLSEEADEISKLVVAFYMFKDNRYDEVNIEIL